MAYGTYFYINLIIYGEDGEVEYDLTFPTDPNFPSEDQTSPNPTKTSILDFLDFNSKEQFSESCDKFMKELIS